MSLQSNILRIGCKALLADAVVSPFLQKTSSLHRTATSGSLRVAAEHSAESLVPPAAEVGDVEKGTRVKSLKEMPGPSAIGNLVEFFYRDGFARIHEIQVSLFDHMRIVFTSLAGKFSFKGKFIHIVLAQVILAGSHTVNLAINFLIAF